MLNISVGGDPAGGYLVDVHDGDKRGTYTPQATNDHGAFIAAIKEHGSDLLAKFRSVIGVDPAMEKELASAKEIVQRTAKQRDDANAEVARLNAVITVLNAKAADDATKAKAAAPPASKA